MVSCTSIYVFHSGNISALQTTSGYHNKNAMESDVRIFFIKTLACLHGAVSDRQAKYIIHVSQYIQGKKRLFATSTIVLSSIYWPCVIGSYWTFASNQPWGRLSVQPLHKLSSAHFTEGQPLFFLVVVRNSCLNFNSGEEQNQKGKIFSGQMLSCFLKQDM